uniref:Uncharacterized protein n=1 Tax=Siphoviridae sp. ctZHD14 TaxID=2827891 RepID=A0A8S5SX34_9CAUD|nr:MAG TPA: hypothetical protein [Siphoviridae sp. ctZHD14]
MQMLCTWIKTGQSCGEWLIVGLTASKPLTKNKPS